MNKSNDEQIIIVFASNSEMSGGKLDTVRLIRGNINFLSKCSETKFEPKEIKTKSGIVLGMKMESFTTWSKLEK